MKSMSAIFKSKSKNLADGGEQEVGNSSEKSEKGTGFTIGKVHIRPGKPFSFQKEFEQWDNCLTTLPLVPEKPQKYIPMPYTFRLPPAPKPTHIKNVVARSPPFHVLLDHTISVIWMLFSSDEYNKSPLGIVQIQWALAFLKTINSRNGDRPKDIELCIDHLEDYLVDEYARLSTELEKMKKLEEKVHFADGALGSRVVITQKFPFSKNYADMIHKIGMNKSSSLETLGSEEAQQELEKLKTAAGVASIEKLDSVSKEKAINVLKAWYNEQTGKIKDEMKKLKSIADQIENVDNGTFQYLDAEQMEMLFNADD